MFFKPQASIKQYVGKYIELVDKLYTSLISNGSDEAAANMFKDFWMNLFSSEYILKAFINCPKDTELFKYEYDFLNHTFGIYFNISELQDKLKSQSLMCVIYNYRSIEKILEFDNIKGSTLNETSFKKALLAIQLPTSVNKKLVLIDGNHRLSVLAPNKSIDINVFCVIEPFLNKLCFYDYVSFVSYNLIFSYYLSGHAPLYAYEREKIDFDIALYFQTLKLEFEKEY